ncbi:hypothetical protein F8M41_003019 [Gigaspora margarita]|uniref:CCHC-type domain-containing protein n=1 Tax=Gigaspora margarita TaxID=4874 RepID=A0A8H4ES36_GIGMA|nr:hypothetical protein F8M41_003019 [Gigaspora margarita]
MSKSRNQKKQISQIGYNKPDNADLSDNDHSLEEACGSTEERKGAKKCSICNLKGHNACTCSNLVESSSSEDEASNRRKCGVCNLRGHNARTCPNK